MLSLPRLTVALLLAAILLPLAACKSQQAQIIDGFNQDVDKPVVGWGLRKLDPKDYPDFRPGWADAPR